MGNEKNLNNLRKKEYHYIYQTKCLCNNKLYIGRHSTDNINDGYLGSGKLLKRAINKYGEDNFEIIILDFKDSYEELVEEEKYLVNKEWCEREDTYNLVEGGENPIMYGETNPSWKGGISKDPNYRKTGRVHYFKGENNPRYGYKYTEDEKSNMILTQKTRCKLEGDGVIYESIRECSRITGMSRDGIAYRIKSKNFVNWNKI